MAMEKKAIAQFTLENGTNVYFEVPKPSGDSSTVEVALGDTVYKVAEGAAGSFEKALDMVKPVANAVISRIKDGLTTPADEVEVKFGFKLTVGADVIFSSVGGEASFEVTLKWKK
jgi:hypothetical protein